MKFGTEWKARMARIGPELSPRLRNACIDYRMWKKWSKKLTMSTRYQPETKNASVSTEVSKQRLLEALERQVEVLDRAYAYEFSSLSKSNTDVSLLFFFCAGRRRLHDRRWRCLYEFVAINRKVVYKIAKRLDKNVRFLCNDSISAVEWYCKCRSTVIPLGSHAVLSDDHNWKILQLHCKGKGEPGTELDRDTCPICLEDDYARCVVLRCGHVVCRSCVIAMIGAENKRGTLQNLVNAFIQNGRNRCPTCRYPGAFSRFDEYSYEPYDHAAVVSDHRTDEITRGRWYTCTPAR